MSLLRKKFRTALTIGSFAVAMFLFGLLIIVRIAFNQGVEMAGADRLIVMNQITVYSAAADVLWRPTCCNARESSKLPTPPGSAASIRTRRISFRNLQLTCKRWRQMYPEFVIAGRPVENVREDREGAIVGEGTAKRFGWKVGDRIPIKGAIYTGNWQFNIDGIYTGSRKADDTTQFWFHYDHLNESPVRCFTRTPWAGTSCG